MLWFWSAKYTISKYKILFDSLITPGLYVDISIIGTMHTLKSCLNWEVTIKSFYYKMQYLVMLGVDGRKILTELGNNI